MILLMMVAQISGSDKILPSVNFDDDHNIGKALVWNDNVDASDDVDAADDNDDGYGNDFENFDPGGREGEGGSWKKLEQVQVGLFYHLNHHHLHHHHHHQARQLKKSGKRCNLDSNHSQRQPSRAPSQSMNKFFCAIVKKFLYINLGEKKYFQKTV